MPNLDRAFVNGLLNPEELARALRESPLDPTNGATSTGVTRLQYLEKLYSKYDQILGFPVGTTKELWSDQHEGQTSGNPALDQLVNFSLVESATKEQKQVMLSQLSDLIVKLSEDICDETQEEFQESMNRLADFVRNYDQQ